MGKKKVRHCATCGQYHEKPTGIKCTYRGIQLLQLTLLDQGALAPLNFLEYPAARGSLVRLPLHVGQSLLSNIKWTDFGISFSSMLTTSGNVINTQNLTETLRCVIETNVQ